MPVETMWPSTMITGSRSIPDSISLTTAGLAVKACGSLPRLWRETITPCFSIHFRSAANWTSTGSKQDIAGSNTARVFMLVSFYIEGCRK